MALRFVEFVRFVNFTYGLLNEGLFGACIVSLSGL